MEEQLTLGELLLLLSKKRELTSQEQTFLAALKGIDLGNNKPGEADMDIVDDPDAVDLFGYEEE